jgi:beta-1,4-mannooligosaccharide/beta-1,4-mannosyl-N-acetylglucosamine phosphorylase
VDRREGQADSVWRYSAKPIIPLDLIPSAYSIFNSAIAPFRGGFAGVYRFDTREREMNLHRGFGSNGFAWKLDRAPIGWTSADRGRGRFE